MTIQKILVPLDGSDLAEQALLPASQIAQTLSATLIFVQIPVPKPTGKGSAIAVWPEQSLAEAREETAVYLQSLAEKYNAVNCTTQTLVGDAASAILDFATEQQVDLIVMSTHGRSGMERWLLGSVTERVLRQSPCPVFAIRSNDPIHKIAITLDGSRFAEEALQPGLMLAHCLSSEIVLLRVSEVPDYVNPLEVAELERVKPELAEAALTGFHERTINYLETLQNRLAEDGIVVQTAVAHGNNVHQSILTLVEEQEVDLIVMATHGHTGLSRWVYGSVTEKVLHATAKHMLVVRPNLDS